MYLYSQYTEIDSKAVTPTEEAGLVSQSPAKFCSAPAQPGLAPVSANKGPFPSALLQESTISHASLGLFTEKSWSLSTLLKYL